MSWILVVDVGTSSVRCAAIDAQARVAEQVQVAVLPGSPAPGMVELNAAAIAAAVREGVASLTASRGAPDAVGVANQRASALCWDATTLEPLGPAIGWQDLRTVFTCLELQAEGFRLAPNMTATKLAAILDEVDPDRSKAAAGALRLGTVDTYVTAILSRGALHVTDLTNAAVTGLLDPATGSWDEAICARLGIPIAALATVVDSIGTCGEASAVLGAPPVAGIAGDQQASLFGQGCVLPGQGKVTFGTGGMLDVVTGPAPLGSNRLSQGTFPIVARSEGGQATWGVEAIMLSAGTAVEWLRDDLGVIASAAESDALAASVPDAGGLAFVPALLGLGTPVWDFGARGTLLGITRGSSRAQLVHAVLDGVAQRAADLVDAAAADTGSRLAALRVDGGMSANASFLKLLANATGLEVQRSTELEATALGAGLMAGVAIGTWSSAEDAAATWSPAEVVAPATSASAREASRERWLEARGRAEHSVPDLSALDF